MIVDIKDELMNTSNILHGTIVIVNDRLTQLKTLVGFLSGMELNELLVDLIEAQQSQ